MKSLLVIISIVLLSVSCRTSRWEWLNSRPDSPAEICWRVRGRVKYKQISKNKWVEAKDIWDRGYGDCKDFAICINNFCKLAGFDSELYLIYNKENLRGHVVTIGKHKEKMWLSSNGSYECVDSLKDAVNNVISSLKWNIKDISVVPLPDNMIEIQYKK